MSLLNLIKWRNLAMLVLMALLMRFSLIPYFTFEIQINHFEFLLLISALGFKYAGANIIINVYNSVSIQINDPKMNFQMNKINSKSVLILYFIFTFLGLISALGFAISIHSDKAWLIFSCTLLGAILYLAHAIYFQNIAILGNFVKSFLSVFSIIIIGCSSFNLLNENFLIYIISIFTLNAFLLSFASSILKNIEEIQGDYFSGKSTLPILIGKSRSQFVAFFFIILAVLLIISSTLAYFIQYNILMFYVFVTIVLPLIVISKKVLETRSKQEIIQLKKYLSYVYLLGLFMMLIFKFI
ncbi:UbiA prenyltransferase family protein [Psychroflexus aestuariivivens]|uniref:UbiA family prenyltransferase n=1 Tax=Psychroflexus aestuariivivens TaxID=1795040 RepID=UPI000FDC2DE0|nr:UbiA family prenyltransferase [Psychroflexus aestuariivivens]